MIIVADNSELVITEFKNKLIRLFLNRSIEQAHPANLLIRQVINSSRPTQTYARTTSHVPPVQRSEECHTYIKTEKNRLAEGIDIK